MKNNIDQWKLEEMEVISKDEKVSDVKTNDTKETLIDQ